MDCLKVAQMGVLMEGLKDVPMDTATATQMGSLMVSMKDLLKD